MNIKIVFAIVSALFSVGSSTLFLIGLFKGKIKPHTFTWLIWAITQGTAVAAILIGGGGIGALGLIIGEIFILFIFILSFWYGTKNIRKIDIIFLSTALVAILIWWQVKNPIYSIILVMLIDVMGYGPTLRKTFSDPTTEKALPWLLGAGNTVFAILALQKYSLLTIIYPAALALGNLAVVMTVFIRKNRLIQR